jgi:predicted O-methyltransferase YrrM
MNKNSIDIEKYIEAHSSPELPILTKIFRETNLTQINPRMVSGHNQGLFLSFISKMIKPLHILEIGTYTGYSAICLAQGLQRSGALHTIEIDDEVADLAGIYFAESGLNQSIQLHVGDALKVIPQLNIMFDLIFIDGEKREYPAYFHTCIPYLNKGGYLIADNALWEGKVIESKNSHDKATVAINEFNTLVSNDKSLESLLLPLRDGLILARKKD